MDPSLSGGHAGQLAAALAEGGAGVDRLSALPEDVLLRILVGLGDAAAAGRTSVLASRWRRLWVLLPELRFLFSPSPRLIASSLLAHESALTCLVVGAEDAAAEAVAAWLPVAARRLSGRLVFTNRLPGRDPKDAGEERGVFELPCFGNATRVSLDLGWLGLAVPLAGVFARLTELCLSHVMFRGPCDLGDAVSSRRCPCLLNLTVRDTMGLTDLTIRSDSLRQMELADVCGLQQLTVVVPVLEHLTVLTFFCHHRSRLPVADISARQLKVLRWGDLFDRSSVKLDRMKHLQSVCTDFFLVYGPSSRHNPCLALLRCFKVIQELYLTLFYLPDIRDQLYLLEDTKLLPGATFLHLSVVSNGHAFGASLFHVLKLCSGTRKLAVKLFCNNLEQQTACPPGCICDDKQNWKTENLVLNQLHEVDITEFRGLAHEVTFVKQLLNWAIVLRKMTVTFQSLVAESTAKVLWQILWSFSRPEIISMEFDVYKGMVKVLYAPED